MGEAGSPPINRLAMHRLCLNERSTLSWVTFTPEKRRAMVRALHPSGLIGVA